VRFYNAAHLQLSGLLAEAKAEYKRSLSLHDNEAAKLGLQRLAKEKAGATDSAIPLAPAKEPAAR
jgi:hypothetical protein